MRKIAVALLFTLFISCKKNVVVPDLPNTDDLPTSTLTTGDVSFVPVGLPQHIAFGTEGDVTQGNDLIAESEYQYQYLAGDIFAKGWAHWNLPAGQFARNFLEQTSKLGKIPVFTYYNIVPAKARYEDPGFTNLSDAEVMNKYFDDWKLLLQVCASYGKKVIIHYEPDLFGYMEMYRKDAAKSIIKVDDSNQADAKGFTNDAKGLAQAIVSMRNKYAPNVLLGWHASTWATGLDAVKDGNSPNLIAFETAAYYKSLQAPFDLIFSEFSDRDAGYQQFVAGKLNDAWSVIANAANGNLSDFDKFQHFLNTLNQQTGRKIILWQIPIGNTVTKTCNNQSGHYQDNTAEYFLQPLLKNGNVDKLNQYGQAGVIAFLFGRGTDNCTSFMDSKADGITGANETADDDGGYLRKAIKFYYKNGVISL